MAAYFGKKKLIAIGVGLVVCAGVAIQYALHQVSDQQMKSAMITTSMQVIGAVVIGGAAKHLTDAYQRQKQKFDHLRDFRWRIRSELVEAYSEIEKAKCILVARGRREPMPPGVILTRTYDEQLEKICVARLEIRGVRHQVEVGSSRAFVYERSEDNADTSEVKRRLIWCLTRMEAHVGALIDEWERTLPGLPSNSEELPVPNHLAKFLLPPDAEKLTVGEFAYEYGVALFILRSPPIDEYRTLLAPERAVDDQRLSGQCAPSGSTALRVIR